MTPAERQRAIAHLEQTRERMLRMTPGLSPEQWQFKPAPDRWSLAELVEHVAFVEARILRGIQKALQNEPAPSSLPIEDQAFIEKIIGRSNRMKAPDQVVPSGRWPLEQLIPEFEAARDRTLDFAKTTDAPLRQHSYPHPFFGPLDCYQWLLLIGSHCERHRLQAEEVIADARFPRAASA